MTYRTILPLLMLPLLLVACSGAPSYNASVFPYDLQQELITERPVETVILASINLGGPSRGYLDDVAPKVDKAVTNYLRENGYNVISQRRFQQQWKSAVRAYGNPIDPTTGRVNQKTFTLCLMQVRDELSKTDQVDAIVFTDIIEREITFSGGLKHLARWDGVSRKPSLQGPGDGVSTDFDWNRTAKAASLWVSVYNEDLQRVFTSIGGMDTTEAIDTRSSSGESVRRRSILDSDNNVREGIELAFHPLIKMKNYPGDKQ